MKISVRINRGQVYLINLIGRTIESEAVFFLIFSLTTARSSRHFADTLTAQKVFPGDSDLRVITAMPQRPHYLLPLIAIWRWSD